VKSLAGKLSDSTAKLLEEMAKKSGLALKQINEVRGTLIAACAFRHCFVLFKTCDNCHSLAAEASVVVRLSPAV
jgi:hypothetical protein